MGLLIQTSVLIMVIAIITYSRLDLFIPKKALEHQIVSFMTTTERNWMNTAAKAYYDNLSPSNHATGTRSASTGTAFISLRPLFGENEEQANNTKILLRSLLVQLYAKQPFVTNEIKKGSYTDAENLFRDVVDAIALAGRNRALYSVDDKNLMTEDQFFRLNIGALQPVFVNIVNGCSCRLEGDAEQHSKDSIEEDDEEGESESQNGVIPRNYCSLFTFANMQPYKPLSIYLAPEEVLMALYGNQQVVDEIIRARTIANKEYKKDKNPEAKAALERFKNIPAVIDSKFLDFNVTTTDPNRKRKVK